MYVFYVDESGDTGFKRGSTRYFALSGLVVHEVRWHQTLDAIVEFRKSLRSRYGLKLREEIHAGHLIQTPGDLSRIKKSLRLRLLGETLDFMAGLQDISIVNLIVDKKGRTANYDVFTNAWQALVQRFHNTISYRNFPGPSNPQDHGLLIVDRTEEKKLRDLTRRMRRYNPVPSKISLNLGGYRQILLTTLVEDAVHRDSMHSYFLQLVDVSAYFLHQKFKACRYIKRKGAKNYFDRLGPVLCKVAATKDPQGIVRL